MFARTFRAALKPRASALARPRKFNAPRAFQNVRFYADPKPVAGENITITLATPYDTLLSETKVDSVILPGLEGEFEVNASLVPIITELQPGLLTVVSGSDRKKFFVSGGFVFVHEDSTCNINPVECVELDKLDVDMARTVLSEYQSKFNSAQNEQDKAVAQIGIETAEAILRAVQTK
eukprot:TRINITY_DN9697_c0_g1_i1.p1 TRINITY_DN9697_c0_g1~~TRINITY_DN9697_c0_g1_i1.p1  ORF type:complete len:178 (-),score=40.86 TRINITY_DN9697_c0_g1_i1:44-577(-)